MSLRGRCFIGGLLLAAAVMLSSGVLAQVLPGQIAPKSIEAAEPAAVAEPLTDAQIDSLLSGLTDAQARDLLRAQLKSAGGGDGSSDGADGAGFLDLINEQPALIGQAVERWVELVLETPERVSGGVYRITRGEGYGEFLRMLGVIVGLTLIAGAVDWGFGRLIGQVRVRLRERPVSTAAAKCGRMVAVALLDIVSLAIFVAAAYLLYQFFLSADGPDRKIAINLAVIVVIVRGIGIISRFFLAPHIPNIRLAYFTDESAVWTYNWIRRVILAISVAFVVQGLITHLRIGAPDFRTMVDTFIGALVMAVIVHGIWQRKEQVGAWMRGEGRLYKGEAGQPDAGLLSTQLAEVWHILASAYVVIVFLWFLVNGLTGGGIKPTAVLLSLAIVPAVPILDSAARHVIEALVLAKEKRTRRADAAEQIVLPDEAEDRPQPEEGTEEAGPADDDKISGYHPLAYVAHRLFRVALVIVSLIAFLNVWGFDAVASMQSSMAATTAKSLVQFAVAVGIGYVVWEFINAFTKPHMPDPDAVVGMDEGGGKATHNRLETLMPLIRAVLLTALVIMVAMIALSSFGVDIGPLLAGAGVVGIALGFGAQKLVADVISGIFFLIDDAFRVGEYVDTGQVKGTVEKISVRSLQLRHHRGALHTIPFGEIRHLTNYHRDWAIVKMEFRVPYETDIEKVRKIIKKEGQAMFEDPAFGENMLAPLKSQGVARMEDSAMIIRTKFTAVPGEQFVIRREAYRRIQEALHNNGIQFAQRRVTVELASGEELDTTDDTDGSRVTAAAGGAALAAQVAEEGTPAAPTDSR